MAHFPAISPTLTLVRQCGVLTRGWFATAPRIAALVLFIGQLLCEPRAGSSSQLSRKRIQHGDLGSSFGLTLVRLIHMNGWEPRHFVSCYLTRKTSLRCGCVCRVSAVCVRVCVLCLLSAWSSQQERQSHVEQKRQACRILLWTKRSTSLHKTHFYNEFPHFHYLQHEMFMFQRIFITVVSHVMLAFRSFRHQHHQKMAKAFSHNGHVGPVIGQPSFTQTSSYVCTGPWRSLPFSVDTSRAARGRLEAVLGGSCRPSRLCRLPEESVGSSRCFSLGALQLRWAHRESLLRCARRVSTSSCPSTSLTRHVAAPRDQNWARR